MPILAPKEGMVIRLDRRRRGRRGSREPDQSREEEDPKKGKKEGEVPPGSHFEKESCDEGHGQKTDGRTRSVQSHDFCPVIGGKSLGEEGDNAGEIYPSPESQ